MSRLFGVAGVQMQVVPYDPQATTDKMAAVASNLVKYFPWVQLIMFQELVVPGFDHLVTLEDNDWLVKKNEPVPGPMSEKLCNMARSLNRWLIPGSMYEVEGDKLFNTAVVISPQGEIVRKYRKMFPWMPYEKGVTPGDEFCTFDIPYVGRFGLCICYDLWFPEVSRTLAWQGAEVILQPTSTATSDRELELVLCRANALFNQCYFISVNTMGTWGGGRSIIIDPDGRIVQEAGTNQTVLTEMIDLDHTTRTRQFGTLGLNQTLKQLRDSQVTFPIYKDGKIAPGSFSDLGELKYHQELEPDKER